MKKASLFIIITLVAFACKKDEDKNAPIITQFKIEGEAIEVFVNAGNDMLAEMAFSDDQELNQYRLEFSDNFSKANGFEPFSFVVVNNVSGTSSSNQLNIPIPDSVIAGPYEAKLNVIDKKGNESATSTIMVSILNTNHQAVINISSPDLNQNFQIQKGDTLDLQGQITDGQDLELICIWLEADTLIYNEVFDLSDTLQASWDFNELALQDKPIIIPTNAETGPYVLVVRAEDNDEHITVHQSTIAVVD